jgi:large subunit ribosomal protein L35
MPKMKSNRGAAKRFKLTASGKVRYKKSNARHILTTKSRARKRRLRKPAIGAPSDERRVKRLLNLA